LSGLTGVGGFSGSTGKTTAITQLGKNHQQLVHRDQPHPGGSLPVAYVTVPPAATPKMLAVEFARFLGLPLPARFSQVELTNKVCDLLGTLRTTLILIDELHNLDLGTRVGAEESDQIKYLSERVPATFVLAGVDLEGNGLFAGRRGGQIASTARPARASPGSSSNARPATSFSACATSDGCTARNNTPCTLHQRWTQRLNQLRHDPPPPLPTQPLPRRTGNVPGNGPPHRAGRITSLANHPPAARRSRAPSRAAVIRPFRPARAKPS